MYEDILSFYKKLTKTDSFIGNNPITFSKETYNPKKEYSLTLKLDGERRFLLVLKNKGYLISNKKVVTDYITLTTSVFNGTIVDGELYKGSFYSFDILFYKGKDIRKLPFMKRISFGMPFIKNVDYIKGDTASFEKLKVKNEKKFKEGLYDGIIFKPHGNYYNKILKWKPVTLLSIDFKIKKEKPQIFSLLRQNDEVYAKQKVTQKDYTKYCDLCVVEFIYKKGKFVPLRARPDKVISNSDKTILSNMKEILAHL